MKNILLISLMFGRAVLFAQHYNATVVAPFPVSATNDTTLLTVEKITPEDLRQIVLGHPKIMLFFYKPYCPGLKEMNGLDKVATAMHYCHTKNITVAFIAVAEEEIQHIHTNYINNYDLAFVHPYVVNDNFSHKAYEKVIASFGQKMKRPFFYIENGKIIYQSYSYNFDINLFKSIAK